MIDVEQGPSEAAAGVGISRRRFLAVTGGILVPLVVLGTRAWTGLAGRMPEPGEALTAARATRLANLLPHPESARAVGRAWLASSGAERGRADVIDALADDLGASLAAIDRAPEAALARGLAGRIAQDFADEHLAIVDGWVLSRTEVRLCALTVLAEA